MNRPPEISSIVSARLARIAGLWNAVQATNGPSSTRLATAASAASNAHACTRPPGGGPRPRRGRGGGVGAGPRGGGGGAMRRGVGGVLAGPQRVVTEILDGSRHVEDLAPA